MEQKVVCDRAHICKDSCEHKVPHIPVIFDEDPYGTLFKCTDKDDCGGYMVRCVAIGIDFEIEELFIL